MENILPNSVIMNSSTNSKIRLIKIKIQKEKKLNMIVIQYKNLRNDAFKYKPLILEQLHLQIFKLYNKRRY